MNRFALRQLTSLACATTLICLMSGCSSMEEDKINYKSASKQLPTLEVPPDLTQIRRDGRYQINGATSALAIANASSTPTSASTDSGIAPNQAGDARIERVGNQRVLIGRGQVAAGLLDSARYGFACRWWWPVRVFVPVQQIGVVCRGRCAGTAGAGFVGSKGAARAGEQQGGGGEEVATG